MAITAERLAYIFRESGFRGLYKKSRKKIRKMYRAYKKQQALKRELPKVYAARLEIAEEIESIYEELGDKKKAAQAEKIINELRAAGVTSEALEEANIKLKKVENAALKKALKEKYVKRILPEEYNIAKAGPIQNKAIFLNPRRDLNLSNRIIYDRFINDKKYDTILFSLYRIDVSETEFYHNAVSFIKEMATAKFVFTHVFHDLFDYLEVRPETKIVNLWHGCGIIKKLGLSCAGMPGMRTLEDFKEYPMYKNYSLVTMPGEGERWIFEEMMGLEKGDPVLQPVGVSRTDEFYEEGFAENARLKAEALIPGLKEGKKIILYAPTYRGDDNHRVSPDALDIAKMAKALSDDYVLVLRYHGTVDVKKNPPIPEEYNGTFAFDMTKSSGNSINEWMAISDIIISDYSSVVYEFALFERPILFFMFDIDDYSESKGMYYTAEQLAQCGPILKTTDEIIDYLLHLDERFDKQKVIDFKNKYMGACDGHATERILKYIGY